MALCDEAFHGIGSLCGGIPHVNGILIPKNRENPVDRIIIRVRRFPDTQSDPWEFFRAKGGNNTF